ncbi:carboxymuconolactone decarboxylase family protein [Acetobacter suratthaniensis]|uniref:Carboxymuconolactone decarboxylase family protein n=1 Tax=Acetobacter suratthaniensis TaxID=1502841 RepID=A0ABS3LJK2_9PROT|nr:carboxymuconolactone decarboxylase family protein [Acetobacter suratthaniensis]MBO1327771.1 carboxymuconolactone decarboxylase family protein [Acetobacter suratthaniensis]MCX2565753.1 carboxymuconolactone decarboxylase family protein [Acetobacter suratthaniensis]
MKACSTIGQQTFGDVAPAFADLTDRVLFDEIWERPGLSPRDKSMITVSALVALYRVNELPPHLEKALNNGVALNELKDLITHLAFYAGWPAASTALGALRGVIQRRGVSEDQQGTDQ